jgi:hypothetical protein
VPQANGSPVLQLLRWKGFSRRQQHVRSFCPLLDWELLLLVAWNLQKQFLHYGAKHEDDT